MQWVQADTTPIVPSQSVTKDKNITVNATILEGLLHHTINFRKHWTGIKLHGKLAYISLANHSVSHIILQNTNLYS